MYALSCVVGVAFCHIKAFIELIELNTDKHDSGDNSAGQKNAPNSGETYDRPPENRPEHAHVDNSKDDDDNGNYIY